jgi:glutathione peroxidase-family protein
MRFFKFTVPVLLTVLLMTPAVTVAGEYNMVMSIGDPLPVFENLPTTDDGTLSTADIEESVLVLVSLANHCPWVKGMDAGLVELVEQFKGQDVRVVGFAVNHRKDDRLPAMKEHAAKNGYNFTYMYDESQDLGRNLGATRTPEYFVFNADRKLVYMGLLTNSPARKTRSGEISFINGDPVDFYVANAVAATLAGKAVDPAQTRAHGCTLEYQ